MEGLMSEGVCPPTEEKKEKKLSEEVGGGGCDKACNKDCWRVLWDVSPLCETARPTMAPSCREPERPHLQKDTAQGFSSG